MDKLPLVYLIGPLFLPSMSMKHSNYQDNDDATTKRCLQLLDLQPARSLVYMRFNGISSMSEFDIMELSIGLEGSGKGFLSVLRNSVVVSEGFNPSTNPWQSAVSAFFLDRHLFIYQDECWYVHGNALSVGNHLSQISFK